MISEAEGSDCKISRLQSSSIFVGYSWNWPATRCPSCTPWSSRCNGCKTDRAESLSLRHQNYVQIFTDGSKVGEKDAAAAVSSVTPNSPFSCRLRDHCSIYTAELQAILFALKQAYQSQERKFMIFSDSLSALQVLGKLKTGHHLLIQIQELLQKNNADQKEIVFMWVLWHVGIWGNEAADRAVKQALDKTRQPTSCLFQT